MDNSISQSLYTWVDVQLVLDEYRAAAEWPAWLVSTSVYFDALLFLVRPGTSTTDTDGFARKLFDQRFQSDDQTILLEGAPGQKRAIRIEIEEASDTTRHQESQVSEPFFRRLATLPSNGLGFISPTPFSSGTPDVVAFYSFKGGVGRTTHLLAFLQTLASRTNPAKALIIDADLEAPGITSLLAAEKSFRPPEFSLADLLALAQSDPSENFDETLLTAAHAVRSQVLNLTTVGNLSAHFVLPAYRSEAQAIRLDVRPEHLVTRPGKSWVLAELIARLGKQLGVDAVLIDLRAGFSELASPFLFDSRLCRIIVTTPSKQSLDGTKIVLQQLAKIAPATDRKGLRDPSVVISFLLPELINSELLADASAALLDKYPGGETEIDLPRLQIQYTTFGQEFLYLPSISAAVERLSGSSMSRAMGEIASDLAAERLPVPTIAPQINLDALRRQLSNLAGKLEYAESGEGNLFLRTSPLRVLAQQFAVATPIAVIMGSKGAGKTYTYLQIVKSGDWSEFVKQAIGLSGDTAHNLIWPVLESKNLNRAAISTLSKCRAETAGRLGVSSPLGGSAITDLIGQAVQQSSTDETWWRHRWFTIFAKSLGIEVAAENEGASRIVNLLRQTRQRLILVIDGLEDLFPELDRNEVQRIALRALLQGVPNYLREAPDSPLGILVFVRGDLARAAITQNFGQFSNLYEAFALRWNEEEALRLAVWLADAAGLKTEGKSPERMTIDEAREFLNKLWGRKLGPEDSREARTAQWVIAALSDFVGQIQARDLVRFLRHAAASARNSVVTDRVLAPKAIRDAILPCSKEKIDEIKQEIPRLAAIFRKLQDSVELRIPFDAVSSGLTVDEIRFLETVGALVEVKGEYFMPEIFRLGLGFQLSEGKRPRVLGLARRS